MDGRRYAVDAGVVGFFCHRGENVCLPDIVKWEEGVSYTELHRILCRHFFWRTWYHWETVDDFAGFLWDRKYCSLLSHLFASSSNWFWGGRVLIGFLYRPCQFCCCCCGRGNDMCVRTCSRMLSPRFRRSRFEFYEDWFPAKMIAFVILHDFASGT
jgi:hypothetical protein